VPGKTTLSRVLTTLLRPTAGHVTIDGFDVVSNADRVRRRIGVTGQYAGLDEFLSGRENLELIGRLTGLGPGANRRVGELIDRLDLGELAGRRVGQLSGGSRRRIDLAASLVGSPSVLFLDEPTTSWFWITAASSLAGLPSSSSGWSGARWSSPPCRRPIASSTGPEPDRRRASVAGRVRLL
jgi:ABC-type Na+ transport system ATPase subunit NatA